MPAARSHHPMSLFLAVSDTRKALDVRSPGTLLPRRMSWMLHPTVVRHWDVNAMKHPKAFSAEPLGRC